MNRNRKLLFLSLFSLFLLMTGFSLLTCSATPQKWQNTVEIVGYNNEGSGLFTVDVQGTPPFLFEFYDNPQFEGDPQYSVGGNYSGRYDFSVSLPGTLQNGTPFYLKAKSVFGEWKIYRDKNGNPATLNMPGSLTVGAGDNPILISTKDNLIALSEQTLPWDTHYLLTADIDLTGTDWKPIGNSTVPFTGSFNGAGHVISGLGSISPSDNYCGLFGQVAGSGTVKNLGLKIKKISYKKSGSQTGGLIGYLNQSATVSNCYVTGEEIRGTGSAVGGLIGGINSTQTDAVINCFTDIKVIGEGYPTGNVGGLIGSNSATGSPAIRNCYAAGDVYFEGAITISNVGGLVGTTPPPMSFPVDCVALNRRVLNSPGKKATAIHVFIMQDSAAPGIGYYNKSMECPDGTTATNGARTRWATPINPHTINQNTLPFSNWDFSGTNQIWKWDPATNRPILRKVRM